MSDLVSVNTSPLDAAPQLPRKDYINSLPQEVLDEVLILVFDYKCHYVEMTKLRAVSRKFNYSIQQLYVKQCGRQQNAGHDRYARRSLFPLNLRSKIVQFWRKHDHFMDRRYRTRLREVELQLVQISQSTPGVEKLTLDDIRPFTAELLGRAAGQLLYEYSPADGFAIFIRTRMEDRDVLPSHTVNTREYFEPDDEVASSLTPEHRRALRDGECDELIQSDRSSDQSTTSFDSDLISLAAAAGCTNLTSYMMASGWICKKPPLRKLPLPIASMTIMGHTALLRHHLTKTFRNTLDASVLSKLCDLAAWNHHNEVLESIIALAPELGIDLHPQLVTANCGFFEACLSSNLYAAEILAEYIQADQKRIHGITMQSYWDFEKEALTGTTNQAIDDMSARDVILTAGFEVAIQNSASNAMIEFLSEKGAWHCYGFWSSENEPAIRRRSSSTWQYPRSNRWSHIQWAVARGLLFAVEMMWASADYMRNPRRWDAVLGSDDLDMIKLFCGPDFFQFCSSPNSVLAELVPRSLSTGLHCPSCWGYLINRYWKDSNLLETWIRSAIMYDRADFVTWAVESYDIDVEGTIRSDWLYRSIVISPRPTWPQHPELLKYKATRALLDMGVTWNKDDLCDTDKEALELAVKQAIERRTFEPSISLEPVKEAVSMLDMDVIF